MLACTKADAVENAEAAEINNDDHATKTQDTLADAGENAVAAENTIDGVISYNSTISACEKGQQWEQAVSLLPEMRSYWLEPDVISYSSLISACEKGKQWEQALGLLISRLIIIQHIGKVKLLILQ